MKRFLAALGLVAAFASFAPAEEPEVAASLKFLGATGWQKPTMAATNPHNALLNIPGQNAMAQARFDLSATVGRAYVFANQRAEVEKAWWYDGPEKGESDTDAEPFLIEGGVRYAPYDSLHLSVARENLQWGSSQFVSPANPFFSQNGRGNPMKEIRGSDFLRAVWIPGQRWTVSWIANVAVGEQEMGTIPWRPSQALKVDYTGEETSAALLFHGGPEVPGSVRGYAQWTASEALLLYFEGSVAEGNRLYYPVPDIGPTRGLLVRKYDEGGNFLPVALGGAAYTFEAGPTLSVEYLYNGEGYDSGDAALFRTMASEAAKLVLKGYIDRPETGGFADQPLRQNYLFAQLLQTEIFGRATGILRFTAGLDDGSGVVNFYCDCALSDHFTVFGYGGVYLGENDEEYGMFVRRAFTVGVEYAAF